MTFKILTVVLLTTLASIPARAEIKSGFRDLKWGDAPLSTMTLKNGIGPTQIYTRSSDSLRMGTAKLTSLMYMFVSNKLCSIQILASSENLPAIQIFLIAQWGEPKLRDDESHMYVWESDDVETTGTSAILSKDGRRVTLDISNKALLEKAHAEINNVMKSRAEDL